MKKINAVKKRSRSLPPEERVQKQVEGIEAERCQVRYDEIVEEANEKLADARQELEDGKKEADEKLEDARQELEDGEKKLKDGKKEWY